MTAPRPAKAMVDDMVHTDALPKGWAQSTLGEIGIYLNGRAFKTTEWSDQGRPIIRIQDLTGSKNKPNYYEGEVEDRYVVRPGDFLISWSATLGAYIWDGPEGVLNQHIFKVLTFIDKQFHYYLIRHVLVELQRRTHGSGMVHVTKGRFNETQVSLPPLAEQKQIVAQVEALLAGVNAARERLAKVPAVLKRFRQSVLAAACAGRLTADWREVHSNVEAAPELLRRVAGSDAIAIISNEDDPIELPEIPDSWAWSRCDKICQMGRSITYGVIKLGPPVEGGVPILRSSDVRWLHIDNSHVKRISKKIAADYSRTFLKGGEILITVRGTLGGVSVVSPEMAGFNISREVAMIPIVPELAAQYFSFAIASMQSQSWLSEVTKGVAYTGINIRDLKRLPLSVPPLIEQLEIVRRVEILFALAEHIEQRAKAAAERVETIAQSILARAFCGELMETEAELARREGREYESATQLLKRIQVQREKDGLAKS